MLAKLGKSLIAFLLFALIATAAGRAQTPAVSLRGQVLDPSGAAVPAITVTVAGPGGKTFAAQTDEQGKYAFAKLAPGSYTLTITLKGFNDFVKPGIVIAPGKPQVVDAQMSVEVTKQQITVTESSNKLSVNPEENASSLIMQGKDLEALSDDPDELQSELQALAGPSAGPDGGQIYIDGFTGGQLPPKAAIREIRINQNPFSAQYDSAGYGRIEVLTKPGMDKYHGQFFASGNDNEFNTRNPFATQIPSYHTEQFEGNMGGPINHKTSFFADGERRDIEDDAIVNTITLDQNLGQANFVQAVPTPQTRTDFDVRIDRQVTDNNTLSSRYEFWQNKSVDPNVGQFVLPSAAYSSHETDNLIQVSDSQVLSAKAVTEGRFRYTHVNTLQTPSSTAPAISVLGAFTGGGSSAGTVNPITDSYEFQEYTSVALPKNFLKFGGRFRDTVESSSSNSNFNGTFTFPSLQAYQITQQGLQAGLAPAQILANGGGPSQVSLNTGIPLVKVNYFDFEPYIEDDWKPRPNLTVSAGLRLETQDHVRAARDFAPRLGIAWGLGKGAKTVVRAGGGIFYSRFSESYILNAARYNGVNQLQYIIPGTELPLQSSEFFPNLPLISQLPANLAIGTNYVIDPHLRNPYASQGGIGLERQLSRRATVALTYLNTHGQHTMITRDINAPDPALPNDARPNPSQADIYQYESAGLYTQNQMILSVNLRGSHFSVFGFYTLSHAHSDTSGGGSFPMNQYDMDEDYGRSSYDVRNRMFIGGSWSLPHGIQVFPFIIANSAPPLNLTTGQQFNGDGIFNGRPAFASSLSNPANVVETRFGAFDLDPVPGETIIPINYGTGFSQFSTNLRFSKTWGFGREIQGAGGSGGGGGRHFGGLGPGGLSSIGGGNMFGRGVTTDRRYNLTFSVSARNLFNDINYAQPTGDLSSPLFDKPNALGGGFYSSNAANRRIDFQLRFNF